MGYLWAILAAICWGFGHAVEQKALGEVPYPLYCMFIRVTVLIISIPMLFWVDRSTMVDIVSNRWPVLVLVSALWAIGGLFSAYAVKQIGASHETSIEIIYPVVTCLGCFLIFGEQLEWKFYAGLVSILFGAWLML